MACEARAVVVDVAGLVIFGLVEVVVVGSVVGVADVGVVDDEGNEKVPDRIALSFGNCFAHHVPISLSAAPGCVR
jgi:hypothetical protein